MPSQPILRFAPSPNGLLHLGHAYSALFTAETAAKLGGTMLLRIEDIDTGRCRPEFAAAIYEDLHWLGLGWPEPVMVQSRRFTEYAGAAERLRARELLYPCFCSRTEVAATATATDPDGAPIYPGTCRHLSADERSARIAAGEAHGWRLDLVEALDRTGRLGWREFDPDTGVVTQTAARPERWGDTLIVRKDVPASYHLSVVVDDAAQAITHVTRGRDMEASTGVHVVLQALLDLPQPFYAFHELILGEDGRKLSKSNGSMALRALREAGWTAADVRRRLGFNSPD